MGFNIHGALQKLFNTHVAIHVAYGVNRVAFGAVCDFRFTPNCDQIAASHEVTRRAKHGPGGACRRVSRGKRPPDTEAKAVVPVAGVEPVAVGRAEELRGAVPGTAADDTAIAISTGPRRTVCGRTVVVVMIAILDPLPHVAGRVVKAELIGSERPDG